MAPKSREEQPSSFAKSLFLGDIHEDMVFPYPRMGVIAREVYAVGGYGYPLYG